MEVEVKLYGVLRRHRPGTAPGAPHHPFNLTLDSPSNVLTVTNHLAIPDGLVNGVAVNGETAELDTKLNASDIVQLFPPSAGG